MNTETSITFIGGGNMARALIGGLLASGSDAARITVAEPDSDQRADLSEQFGVATEADNARAASQADVVVLAVKPQVMDQVLASIRDALSARTLIISVAAGITTRALIDGLDPDQPVVRAMPNTPALYGAGMTGLFASTAVDSTHRELAEGILGAAGEVAWIDDETLMDVVTAISGSGPAYFFALAEHLARAGEACGLDAATAERLARQTASGAGVMLAQSEHDAGELRRRVTSPGGTTAAALDSLAADDLAGVIERAVAQAVRRGRELGGN